MKKENSNRLAFKMMIALVLGLGCGIGLIALRENLLANGGQDTWKLYGERDMHVYYPVCDVS